MKKNQLNDSDLVTAKDAWVTITNNPLFKPITEKCGLYIDQKNQQISPKAWVKISPRGHLIASTRRAEIRYWERFIAQAIVALGLGLVENKSPLYLWELTALLLSERFCSDTYAGVLPEQLIIDLPPFPKGGAEKLFNFLVYENQYPELIRWYGDIIYKKNPEEGGLFYDLDAISERPEYTPEYWRNLFAKGISDNVQNAVDISAGIYQGNDNTDAPKKRNTPAQKAKAKMLDFYPLLGALAASFDIEESPAICQKYHIQVAAIDVVNKKIWINSAANLNEKECLFVFAHELLHAGLNHASRRRGRDAFLWNAACDFIINSWLIEMNIGHPPPVGMLYDENFKNKTAEEIYDELAKDIRRSRKLATLRGAGRGDLIEDEYDFNKPNAVFTNAEEYCRRALSQGLERCFMQAKRGLIPAGLIEEIRSLNQPPIPWDVQLAEWFNMHFPALEFNRSYARPSRRQMATPDIPRPAIIKPSENSRKSRVFGVILDTSGSMDIQLLGKALGAIASYGMAHEVFSVRFIECDAMAYDKGWIPPENLLHMFSVQGRGGTVLQPAVDAFNTLIKRGEFPDDGPILIITDAECEDNLQVYFKEYAFLIPNNRQLPFANKAKVFFIE